MTNDDAIMITTIGAVGWTLLFYALAGGLEERPWFKKVWLGGLAVWLVLSFILWSMSKGQ